jgi:hypothetical protein
LADLTEELAAGVELQELRRGVAEHRTSGGTARMIQDRDTSLRVDGDTKYFAQVHVRRVLQKIGDGIERNLWHRDHTRCRRARGGRRLRRHEHAAHAPGRNGDDDQ